MALPSPPGNSLRGVGRVHAAAQAGFTYIGLLVAIVVMGVMLTLVTRVWSVTEQRERETQLLFEGDEFRRAISAYFAAGHQYPQTLQDLVDDKRSPVPKRYLRKIYFDPMTGAQDWTLVPFAGGGIMGVASSSKLKPIKQRNFRGMDENFKDSDCYCQWQFVYQPRYLRNPALPVPSTNPGH